MAVPHQATAPAALTLPWLASVDLMERLSYYGMSAILVLYLTASPHVRGLPGPGLGYSTADAAGLAGSYSALVFLAPLLGGWVADRLLGSSLAVLLGGCVITLGHGLMAMPLTPTFWLGLLAIALGTGLLRPNVTALVGKTQPDDQARRDAAFSLYYMCTNLGAFLAPLVVGGLSPGQWLALGICGRRCGDGDGIAAVCPGLTAAQSLASATSPTVAFRGTGLAAQAQYAHGTWHCQCCVAARTTARLQCRRPRL